jgi:addiction module RelB/DinJ family antitoxin
MRYNSIEVSIMEKTVTMNLRVNPTVKQQAENVLKQLGIPMATAIDMYLRQITMKGGIPFPITVSEAPAQLNADAMNAAQIHDAINAGMNDLREGKVQNAHTAFAAFREAHK